MTIAAYNDHPIRQTIANLLEQAKSPEFSAPVVADNEQFAFARDKTFAQARMLEDLLRVTPAVLVSNHALTQINQQLQAPVNEISAYLSDKNPAHISNACTQFEQNIMPLLWGFGAREQLEDGKLPKAIVEDLSQRASETVRHLAAEKNALIEKLKLTDDSVQALQTKLDSMVESAAKERAEASATVAKLQQEFAEKETERANAFDGELTKIRTDYASLEKSTKDEALQFIAELGKKRDEAAKIVQVVGNIGVTGNYQRIANDEQGQANFWRWATIVFFACGVGVAIATFVRFWSAPVTTDSLGAIAVRLLYAIAITAPAWYTAKESARHRTNSDRARQTELELASLGPFIELLPDDKKEKIREEMTKLYFGRDIQPHTANSPLESATLKDLAELVKSIKG